MTGKIGLETSANASLVVDEVSYSYGSGKALDRVTFSISPGTFAILLGSNGAGKTTLFSLITRLFTHGEGAISIMGHSLHKEPGPALRRLGVVFQARTLDLDLSVSQNLHYHAALHGIGTQFAKSRIREVLADVDLSDKAADTARSLSGGQMRRLEIARALLHRPAVMLLDEATTGLDVRSRQAIQMIIRKLVGTGKLSVLWATHLVDEVEDDDTVFVLGRGKLIASGISADLQKSAGVGSMLEAFMKVTEGPLSAAAVGDWSSPSPQGGSQ